MVRSSDKEDDGRAKHKMPQNREVDLLNKWKVINEFEKGFAKKFYINILDKMFSLLKGTGTRD